MENLIQIQYKKLQMIQLIIDGPSRQALLHAFPPMHDNIYAHHVTIAFKPSESQARELAPFCGQVINFEAIAEASDDFGQAVLVSGIDGNNKFPHITISTSPETKPAYSNELLANTLSHELLYQSIPLTGVLTFILKNKKEYSQPVEIISDTDV